MKTIWKFRLKPADIQDVEMPKGATILTVGWQSHDAVLWAMVDTMEFLTEMRKIEMFWTGEPMSTRQRRYIGTVTDGNMVWHVFELEGGTV